MVSISRPTDWLQICSQSLFSNKTLRDFIMKKRHTTATAPVALLTTLLAATCFPAVAADNLGAAFTQGKFAYSLRWRLENVDQNPLPHDATAIPLRARIGFQTADLYGFSFMAELDYIFNFGVDDFNAGSGNTPNPPGYPVIADPGGEDLNQLFLQYKTNTGSQLRLGRQRIIYDNARFVGNVGWRQNEQTYDSFSFNHKTKHGLNLQYAYVDNVNRIFGDDVPAGDQAQNTHLFNISQGFEKAGKLTGYYYDIDNEDAASLSSRTLGLRFAGTLGTDATKIGYGLEYANQKQNADNPIAYSADYWRVDLSAALNKANIYGGYESLGGESTQPGQAFQTPLATLHAFNGWADKFLSTPAAGLNDVFFGVKGKLGNWDWNVLYHDFSAQSGSAEYGAEIDGSIATKFKQNYGILFKAASFSTDSPVYGDTNKLWLQLTADF
jgi:hypothetical protein